MAEEQKKTQEGFQSFYGGTPCGEMIRKMMETRPADQPFHCTEMMSKMMQMFCRAGEKKEETKE